MSSDQPSRFRLDTPIGPLTLGFSERGLCSVWFHGPDLSSVPDCAETLARPDDSSDEQRRAASAQLLEYLSGRRQAFDLSLDLSGTPFQRRVWQAVSAIPYGSTRTYREIAEAIGQPAAVRAVGAANGANPLPIVIPCHRVVGAQGKLTGYGGGLALKAWLLAHEREVSSAGATR